MKIGVIGIGVVGAAVLKAFSTKFDVIGYDIVGEYAKEENFAQMVQDCPLIFVCVPSLTIDGKQDQTPVVHTYARLQEAGFKGVVCLKSTVLPGTSECMSETYQIRTVHNPEFLTAARPFEDFMEQKAVILGGKAEDCQELVAAYEAILPGIPISILENARYTEIAKYYHNCFLATKVTVANEFYELCKYCGINYDKVRLAAASQGGIGLGHNKVPGPDGKFGFGLGCLPKETLALMTFSKELGLEMDVLIATIKGNSKRRFFDNRCHEVGVESKVM